jgi:heme exporter protein D
MMNWAEFFNMGGYAFYVWGSYGVFALAIAAEIVAVRLRKRRVLAELIESRLAEKNEIET